jgi:hypothetical protein
MATISEQAMKLLDFNQKLDISLLDSIVGCMYSGIGEQVRFLLSLPPRDLLMHNHFENCSKEQLKKCSQL